MLKLSVVVPCRNEKEYIRECIDAIFHSIYPDNVELSVMVVDGMSNDGTREILDDLKQVYDSLIVIDNTNMLTPYAFNLGIKYKPFDFLQIIGARHIISNNYIATSLSILQQNEQIWCVGGRIVNVFTNHQSQIISDAMSTAFGMGIGNFRTLKESSFTDTVTSPMYPINVFEKIGYFDEQLVRNQDDDFNFRIVQMGGKIWFENQIFLKYYVRATFKGLYTQFYQYGYWKVFVNQKHKTVTTLRQLVPPLFVVYIFSLLFSPLLTQILTLFYSSGLMLYLVLLIYVSINRSKNGGDIFSYVRTFFILHFSYGFGYLHGIWNFMILKRKPSKNQMKLSR